MTKKGKIADPHAAREAASYDNPIPSREVILELLDRGGETAQPQQDRQQAGPGEHEQLDALRKRLRAMERDGQLMVNRRGAYGLVDKMNLLHCRVQGHRDGYGFAMPLAEGEDVYLSARQMNFVFDGDEVLVPITGWIAAAARKARWWRCCTRATQHCRPLPGRERHRLCDSRQRPHQPADTDSAQGQGQGQSGQIVTAEITDYPTRQLGAKGRISEILGDHLDPGLEIDVAIRSHGIPWEWPEEVLDEAGRLEASPGGRQAAPGRPAQTALCHYRRRGCPGL